MSAEENGMVIPETETARLAALGQVAGELMHDLANQIAVVKGRSVIALGDARSGRLPVSELERLAESADELGAMLRDVMETLKGKALSPEVTFDPAAVAERVVQRFLDSAPPLDIRLLSSVPPEGVCVAGRASFLARALTNLLVNAARHARRQVRLSLGVEADDGQRVLLVLVEDDGPGIAEEQVGMVFRPLVRGESGGMGLGLSSLVWTITHLGGDVRYRPAPTLSGACFQIRLPLAEPRRIAPLPLAVDLSGYRLLLLEDDPVVRSALVRLLGRAGADAIAANPESKSEQELLDELLRALPDVILLDLRLGISRQGIGIWRMLHSHIPSLARRIVFLSGLGPGDSDWEAARATGQPVLGKPVDLEEIAGAVQLVVQR